MPPGSDIRTLDTPVEVALAAAHFIAESATAAVQDRGRFVIALSGGQTPRPAYECLARPDLASTLPWRNTFVLWTDERCVMPDNEGSNYRMAREALLDHVPLPADNVMRIRGENCALSEDQRYERSLHRLLGDDDRIDLALLGVGADGHTASLFPRSPALAERRRWILPALGPAPYPRRITMTLPILCAARQIVVLATGSSKAHIVRAVREPADPPPDWPILAVRPQDGQVVWFVDREACPAYR